MQEASAPSTPPRSSVADAAPARPGLEAPIALGLAVLLLCLVVAAELRGSEDRALRVASTAALDAVRGDLGTRISAEVSALEGLAARWDYRRGLDEAEWTAEARRLVSAYDEIQAVEWVDSSLTVRRVVPLEGNEVALGLSLGLEIRRRLALDVARELRQPVATHRIDLAQGGQGILIYVPLFPAGEFDGFVVAAHRLSALLEAGLAGVAPGYRVSILDGEELLYARNPAATHPLSTDSATVQILNLTWNVEVATTPQVEAAYRSWTPEGVAAGGCLLALLLAAAVQLARTGRWRAAQLLEESARTGEEMARRTQAEAAEREARDELQAVVASFPDHVWSAHVSADGEFHARYYSKVVEDISGYPVERHREDPELWVQIVVPEDREIVSEGYRSVVQGTQDEASIEYRIRHANGEIRAVRDRLRGSEMPYGRRIDGVTTDVTELRNAEEERLRLEANFQQAQRLESLGVLAGGIAHDFNNLLVGMLGHAELALQRIDPNTPAQRDIGSIQRAARQAAGLCRQMLAYAGKGTLKTESLDLHQTVEEMSELLAASTTRGVATNYAFDDQLPLVEADASQICQVVMNLMTNAAESFGDAGGTIQVKLREVFCSAEMLAKSLADDCEPGRYLELVVADDGCGMDEETLGRIFEPFFSCKFAGRGLGLAAALGIVRRHRGAIRVESQLGLGTTARLLLPALEAAPTQAAQRQQAGELWHGTGSVLLVDDQEDAREVARLVLERAGFRVLSAHEGLVALELLSAHRDEIVCVLLDSTMPGMSGAEVCRKLRHLAPELPVVLCSGYPEDAAVGGYEGLGLSGFLEKPYALEDLLRRVHDAIGSAAGAPAGSADDAEKGSRAAGA